MTIESASSRSKSAVVAARISFFLTFLVIPCSVFLFLRGGTNVWLSWAAFALLLLSTCWFSAVLGSLLFFPFRYSMLGKSKFVDWTPNSPPLLSIASGFSTGNLLPCQPSSMFRFSVFKEGLQIKIWLMGKVFLPLLKIDRIEKGALPFHYVIHHDHPEIRSPINFTSKALFLALGQLMAARSKGTGVAPDEDS